jgi:hypothetical protein
MRRFAALAVLFGVFVSVTAAQAEVTTNQDVPYSLTDFVPCANGGQGEWVTLTGNLHDKVAVTIKANQFSATFTDNPQDVTGTGATTGDKYHATGVTQYKFSGTVGYEETFINNFHLIGQGPGNNLLAHATFHITVNANGDTTVVADHFSTACR